MSSTSMPGAGKAGRTPSRNAMRNAMAGIGLAAVVGIAAAGIIDSSGGGSYSAGASTSTASTGTAIVRTQVVSVSGQREAILVDQQGMPLYYYRGDSATVSRVSGQLARLWPPVTAATVHATGLTGNVAEVKDAHGSQVAYNGHLLYTFVSDRSGVVTGQGVQNFYVATPALAAPTGAVAPPVSRGSGY